MRVKIESTGGFTGRRAVVALYDTDDLPSGPALRVREAVDALAAAQARGGEGETGADLPAYQITVCGGAGEQAGVYEVRGDPATGVDSALAVLLAAPG